MCMKEDLQSRLQERLLRFCMDKKISYENYQCSIEAVEKCTLEQLWTLYDKFEHTAFFTLYAYDPKRDCDYLAMDLNGMYVGIEQDGHAHT